MSLDFNRTPTVDELLRQIQTTSFSGVPGAVTRNEDLPFSPDSDELRSSAEMLISAGDLALARNILIAMIRSGTQVGWALRTLGQAYESDGQAAKARRSYQDAIAYEPHLEAYRCLAILEIRSKNDAAAADALERSLNLRDLPPATRFEIHKACGNCWMRAQRTEKAEHHYKRALAIDPTSDQISSNLGALYLQAGRLRDAQRFFEDALVANAANSRALSGLGAAYLAEGRKREAHDQFAKSLQIELDQPNAIYHLVKCAYEIKSYATAARILGDYVQIAPVNANLLYSLAGLQFHLGRIDEARSTVIRILQIQPTHTGATELSKLIERYATAQSNAAPSTRSRA
jgi:tetratricopeptide (TPR) repeat protein